MSPEKKFKIKQLNARIWQRIVGGEEQTLVLSPGLYSPCFQAAA